MNKEATLVQERHDQLFKSLCQIFDELSQDKEYFEKVSKSY